MRQADRGGRTAQTIEQIRVDSPLGRWVRHEWRPGPGDALAGVVDFVAHCEGEAVIPRKRVFPDTTVERVVHIGAPHRVIRADGSTLAAARPG